MKRKGIGSEARSERMATADVDLQLLGEGERERQLKKQKKRRLQGREDEVCCDISVPILLSLLTLHSSLKKLCQQLAALVSLLNMKNYEHSEEPFFLSIPLPYLVLPSLSNP